MNNDEIEAAIAEGKSIVKRLLTDQDIAQSSWAHMVALHRAYANSRTGFKDQLDRLALSPRLFSLADALIRDTLLALFRMTDNPQKDGLTLCGIAKLLSLEAVQEERRESFEQTIVSCGEQCKQKIAFILGLVPREWGAKIKPKDSRLLSFREQLRPIRGKLIAHASPFESFQLPLSSIEDFLTLTGQLVSAAEWVFRGGTAPDRFQARLRESEEFWQYVVRGFVAEP